MGRGERKVSSGEAHCEGRPGAPYRRKEEPARKEGRVGIFGRSNCMSHFLPETGKVSRSEGNRKPASVQRGQCGWPRGGWPKRMGPDPVGSPGLSRGVTGVFIFKITCCYMENRQWRAQ